MALPVESGDYLGVLTVYNEALWPLPAALSLAAFAAVCFALFPGPRRDRLACAILALLWLWAGVGFAFFHLTTLTPLGYLLCALFLAEAAILVWLGVARNDVRFWMHGGSRHLAGILLIFYALVAYPSVGALLGHTYPASPTFGVPTPVTIFTLGMLLLTRAPYARTVFAVPMLCTVIGTYLAIELRLREDLGLVVAAALVVTLSPSDEGPDAAEHPAH